MRSNGTSTIPSFWLVPACPVRMVAQASSPHSFRTEVPSAMKQQGKRFHLRQILVSLLIACSSVLLARDPSPERPPSGSNKPSGTEESVDKPSPKRHRKKHRRHVRHRSSHPGKPHQKRHQRHRPTHRHHKRHAPRARKQPHEEPVINPGPARTSKEKPAVPEAPEKGPEKKQP